MQKLSCFFLFLVSIAFAEEWTKAAIIVSSKEGLKEDKPLRYAYNDGERIFNVLSSIGNIDQQHLYLIKTESAKDLKLNLQEISRKLQRLADEGEQISLQFYYSGHGSNNHFHIGNQKVSFNSVKSILKTDDLQTKMFILDVCFGASFMGSKGFEIQEPVKVEIQMDNSTTGEVIISSSAINEQSYETIDLEGSVFTSNWILALRGAGDKNKDGKVSLFEAYNFSYEKTLLYTSQVLKRPQHPSYKMNLHGAQDIPISNPFQNSSSIILKNCPKGKYAIIDLDRAINIGEIDLPEQGDFQISLSPSRYEIQQIDDPESPRAVKFRINKKSLKIYYTQFKDIKPENVGFKGRFAYKYSNFSKSDFKILSGYNIVSEEGTLNALAEPTRVDTIHNFTRTPSLSRTSYPVVAIQYLMPTRNKFKFGATASLFNNQYSLHSTGTESIDDINEYRIEYIEDMKIDTRLIGPLVNFNFYDRPYGFYYLDFSYAILFQTIDIDSRLFRQLENNSLVSENHVQETKGYQLSAGFNFTGKNLFISDKYQLNLGARIGMFLNKNSFEFKEGFKKGNNISLREQGINVSITIQLNSI